MCNICAKDVECHRAKKHCKLQGFLSTRSPTGGSAAGAASVYNLRLPPKASGEDTGAGPAPGFKR